MNTSTADFETAANLTDSIFPVMFCPECGTPLDDCLDLDNCWTGFYICPLHDAEYGPQPVVSTRPMMCMALRPGSVHHGKPRIFSYAELTAIAGRDAKVA